MKEKDGFTIIEMMVVIGLIAVLLAFILSSLNENKSRTRDNIRIADIQNIRLALESYRNSCGVFPSELSLTANNGRNGNCSNGVTFGDFLSEIPTAPTRTGSSLLNTSVVPTSAISTSGYFYAGLSTSLNGPCYDYHLGVELELAENNAQDPSGELDADHDFESGEGIFDAQCSSAQDFGSSNPVTDDQNGLYDFRSTDTN